MDFWFMLIFSLAVTLANGKSEAQTIAAPSDGPSSTAVFFAPTSSTIFTPAATTDTTASPRIPSTPTITDATPSHTSFTTTPDPFTESSLNVTVSATPNTTESTTQISTNTTITSMTTTTATPPTTNTTNSTTPSIIITTTATTTNAPPINTTTTTPTNSNTTATNTTQTSTTTITTATTPITTTPATTTPPTTTTSTTTTTPTTTIPTTTTATNNLTAILTTTTNTPPPPPTTSTSTTTTTTTTTTPTNTLPTTNTTPPPPTTNTITITTPTTLTTSPSTAHLTTTPTPSIPLPTTTPPPLSPTTPPLTTPGDCICPDDCVTCLVDTFCPEMFGEFHFPLTLVGHFAYSTQLCKNGTNNAGKPSASARCTIGDESPAFEEPKLLDCSQTLKDIKKNLTSSANLESLATNTQILTSQPEDLTPDNVTVAAQIAQTLLVSPNITRNVQVAAVATVSQLLKAKETDDAEQNNAILGLTITLENLSMNLSLSLDSSDSQVVQPNLVVQSAQIPTVATQGIQFSSSTGINGTFTTNRTRLNLNTSSVEMDNGFMPEALILVRFPKGEDAAAKPATPSNVSLGFVLYQNDRFFRSRSFKRQRATIRVLSGSIRGPLMSQHVEMMFRPQKIDGTSLYEFTCVSWSYELNDWTTHGCSKGNTSGGFLRCFCNHTTNFAALWSFRENYEYAKALDWISIFGLSFSILGLVVTILHHLAIYFFGDPKEAVKTRVVLLSIYITLLAFIITFLSGVTNSRQQYKVPREPDMDTNVVLASEQYVEPDSGPCTAVAALLHFFLLASFLWNCVYGTQLVVLLRSLQSSLPSCWTTLAHVVGWGVPAAIVATTLVIAYQKDNPLGYRQEEFCWLAALDKDKRFDYKKPMFWGFLLPISVILIYNILLLILTSMTTCKTNKDLQSTKSFTRRKKVLISFSVAVLLGLSWITGYLVLVTSGQPQLVLSIIFCICTTTQGFQIFILFTARTPSFRKAMSLLLWRLSEVNNELQGRTYHLWKNIKSFSSTGTYRDT